MHDLFYVTYMMCQTKLSQNVKYICNNLCYLNLVIAGIEILNYFDKRETSEEITTK